MTINSGRSEAGEFIFFEVRPYRKQHELPNDCPDQTDFLYQP